jgi:hypothetical protein
MKRFPLIVVQAKGSETNARENQSNQKRKAAS